MTSLVLGVLLWSGVHLFPSLGSEARSRLIGRVGEGPYKGLFALSLVVAIVLMVMGWRASTPIHVYAPPAWGAPAATLLMFVGLLLFAASALPTNLKRVLRHPQLTGMAVWAGAHLLANGDRRSLVFFGGLGVWAVLTMLAINRRDGAWQKPDRQPLSAELKPLLAAIAAFVALFLAHPYLFNVSPLN